MTTTGGLRSVCLPRLLPGMTLPEQLALVCPASAPSPSWPGRRAIRRASRSSVAPSRHNVLSRAGGRRGAATLGNSPRPG